MVTAGLTATKPYVSGAAYINRMSNYCGHCQYDPKKSTGAGSCPFTALYWTFLERNQEALAGNIRLAMPYNTLRKKSPAERKATAGTGRGGGRCTCNPGASGILKEL